MRPAATLAEGSRPNSGGTGLPTAFFFAIIGLLVALSVWSLVSAPSTLQSSNDDPRARLTAEVRALMGSAPEAPKYGQPPPARVPTKILFGLIFLIAAAFVAWALVNMYDGSDDEEFEEETTALNLNAPAAPPPGPAPPEWLRAAVKAAADGMVAVDSSCRIISANPAAEKLFGFPSGKLAGRLLGEVLPDVGATRDSMRRFAQVTAPAPVSGRTKEGAVTELQVALSRLSDRPDSHFLAIVNPVPVPVPAAPAPTAPADAGPSINAAALDELENQLVMLSGYGEMVLSGMDEQDELRADANAAAKAAARATLLCHELNPATVTPQSRTVDLNQFILKLGERLEVVLDNCEIQALPGTGSNMVSMDPDLLERAVASLAMHAQEWAGGVKAAKLSVTKTRLDLRLIPSKGVSNPPPVRRTSDLLPAVDWIEAQGGAVEMEEHFDTGIRFRLLLPAAVAAAQTAPVSAAAGTKTTKLGRNSSAAD